MKTEEAVAMSGSVPAQIVCPRCKATLHLEANAVVCSACGIVGTHAHGLWDFAGDDDYAQNFGRQWSTFRHTQVDSRNGTTISREQFRRVTGWTEADLDGQTVLDGGCGSGRYAEIACSMGARVTAMDLSRAAYAARDVLPESVTVVRGNLLGAPLRPGSFDRVFSIGVLQHTPDPLGAAKALVGFLRPGGELAIWMYERYWYTQITPKMILRRVTRHMDPAAAEALARRLVKTFAPVARAASHLPGATLRWVAQKGLPIASYWGVLPLSDDKQVEWSLLDTNDWLTPAYDSPQSYESLRRALEEAGATDITRREAASLTVVARRKA